MPSPLAQKAIGLLSPSLGDFVARAKVGAACKLARLDFESFDARDLTLFADKLLLTCEPLGAMMAQQIRQKVLTL